MDVILVGVLSSLIASIVYALLSFGIKPNIKISDNICVTTTPEGNYTYKIKIVNNSSVQLVNVSYHLIYGYTGRDDNSYITEIPPLKIPVTTITKKNKKNTDYALRVTYEIKPGEYECKDNSYFEFSIQATHPLSNSIVCKSVRYTSENIYHDCTFQIGDNVNIIDLREPSNKTVKQTKNVYNP